MRRWLWDFELDPRAALVSAAVRVLSPALSAVWWMEDGLKVALTPDAWMRLAIVPERAGC